MKLLHFISVLLFPVALLAQSNEAVVAKISSMPPSRILYRETIFAPDGAVLSTASGTLELQYPSFCLQYGKFRICSNGETMWVFDHQEDEIVISRGNALETLISDSSASLDNGGERLTVVTKEGTRRVFDIVLTEEMNAKWPESHFVLNEDAVGQDTIVTDLR